MKFDGKQLIEIVGTISVVASLLFVGFQIMLERRVAESEQYQNRARIVIDYHRSTFENDKFIAETAERYTNLRPTWWNETLENRINSGASMEAMARAESNWRMMLFSIDNNYYQYRQGFLEEEMWQANLEILGDVLSIPMVRATWLSATGISAEFKKVLQETIREIDTE